MTFPNDDFCGLGSLQHFLPPTYQQYFFQVLYWKQKRFCQPCVLQKHCLFQFIYINRGGQTEEYRKYMQCSTAKEQKEQLLNKTSWFFIQTTFLVQPPSSSGVAGDEDSSFPLMKKEELLQIMFFASCLAPASPCVPSQI